MMHCSIVLWDDAGFVDFGRLFPVRLHSVGGLWPLG